LISSGRVSVNNNTITELGTKIDPDKDIIKVDGEAVKNTRSTKRFVYILLNKPRGYITTTSDERNRPTVLDLIGINQRIYPVGRLDFDSEGLLLLTNDGDLAYKLMHPKFNVFKTYVAKLNRPIDEKSLNKLTKGILLDGKSTSRAKISVIPGTGSKEIKISIHEGRNRQVRKMLEHVGLFVRRLRRVEYAGLNDKGLKPGQWRYLTQNEMRELKDKSNIKNQK
ncbi:MAG: pseudouridine synthase, partial [Ignavibacteria bacterium]